MPLGLGKLALLAGVAHADSLAEKFEEFKSKYDKNYVSAAEELRRFKIFTHNLESAAKMALLEGATAKYGHMSPLADLSETEFARLNNLPVTPQYLREHAEKSVSFSTLPSDVKSFDWRQKGAVTPVKNQGQCGSCWSFATVANTEGQNFIVNGELKSLSEQELVDCSTSDNGCNGGLPSRAYEDLISSKSGFELESEYGYKGKDGSCGADRSKEIVFLSSWVPISQDESQIAVALMKYGPLALGLNASPMQLYMGGISDPWFCSPSGIDHAVTLVGFGAEDGKDFWTIKNSWGPSWGEEGYYRLIRGKGKCGMNQMVTSAIVAPKSGGEKAALFV